MKDSATPKAPLADQLTAPTIVTINAQVPPYLSAARTGIRSKGGIKRTAFYPVISERAKQYKVHNTYLKPWFMSDPEQEYWAIRQAAGLLDVTGEEVVEVTGPDALKLMNLLVPRDLTKVADGRCRYSIMCYDYGGIVEDAVLARFSEHKFWWVGGPAQAEQWIYSHVGVLDVTVRSRLDEIHVASIQGPKSREILQSVCDVDLTPVVHYGLVPDAIVCGTHVSITRTGYTGELGYDIFVEVGLGEQLFRSLLNAGESLGLLPCGSQALDWRRTEAAILNVGQDFDWTTTPYEVGLDWMIDFDKGYFIGRDALHKASLTKPGRELVGLETELVEPVPLASSVIASGTAVGIVTSAVHSPTLRKSIAIAMVSRGMADIGTHVQIRSTDHICDAIVVPMPFVDPERRLTKA